MSNKKNRKNHHFLTREIIDTVKSYNPSGNLEKIKDSINFAENIYKDRVRLSGKTLMAHALRVANKCAELHLDETTIVSAVLHTVLKYEKSSFETIEDKFGKDVALIIKGIYSMQEVTKKINSRKSTISESTKVILASSNDIRTLIIRLIDKLDDLRTATSLCDKDQRRLLRRIHKIYSPMADFIGLYTIKKEFDDASFRLTDYKTYTEIKELISQNRQPDITNKISKEIKDLLKMNNIIYKAVFARQKGIYSTYQKLKRYSKSGKLLNKKDLLTKSNLKRIHDQLGLTVLSDSVKDCYLILAIINAKYAQIGNEFDDYIANPKSNGYRALQTIIQLQTGDGDSITAEIQIKTEEMHQYNQYGPASHIAYKIEEFHNEKLDDELYVFEDLQKWKKDVAENINIKKGRFYLNTFENNIFVFTKDNDIIRLDNGSTPVDFAYQIHMEVGEHCCGAKVNGKMVKLNSQLKTGDMVEILTCNKRCVNRGWLLFVKGNHTKKKIKQGLRE